MCLSIAVETPDKVLSKGEHAGFQWMTVHNGGGYRCGYVRIPKGHPWHGVNYSDDAVEDVLIHGGLTFSEADKPCEAVGEDDAWWHGFDCAHCDDKPDPELPGVSNASMEFWRSFEGTPGNPAQIRDQEYVEAECRSLCEQAEAADLRSVPTPRRLSNATRTN